MRVPRSRVGLGVDAVVADLDLGAHRAQRLDVEVDRPAADGVAADQRHERLAGQVQQRARACRIGIRLSPVNAFGHVRRRSPGRARSVISPPLDLHADAERAAASRR